MFFDNQYLVCERCGMYFQSKSDFEFHIKICNAKFIFVGKK